MKHKKAQMPVKMVVGLLVVFSLMLVLMLFLAKIDKIKDEKLGKSICKVSVDVYSKSRLIGADFASEINCPTKRLSIPDSDVEMIMNKLSMAMYDCWDQFGRGRLNLFSNEYKEERHCVVCHVIEFKDKDIRIGSERFSKYLKTWNIPSGEMSFEEFFLGYSTYEEDKEKQYTTELADINTELEYSTVFVYDKEGYLSKWITSGVGAAAGIILIPFTGGGSALVGTVVGAVGGGIIGYNMGSDKTTDWNASIVLTPYLSDFLGNLTCTYAPVGQEKE